MARRTRRISLLRGHREEEVIIMIPSTLVDQITKCKILKEKVMTVGNSKSPICLSSDVDDGAVEDKICVRLDFLATQKTGADPKPHADQVANTCFSSA